MMMKKRDDEVLAQLDAIMNELKEGKRQSASTAAVNYSGSGLTFKTFMMLGFKKWYLKILLSLLFLVVAGTLIGIGSYKLFSGTSQHVEKGSFIEHMKELSTLATSQAYVKAVIEKEDNQLFGKEITTNFPGTKRKLLLVVPGTVTAGVDLQNLKEDHITIDEDNKKIDILLAHAAIIQEPSLQFEEIQTYSVEGIFREEVEWEEAYELAAEASNLVKEEAIAQGLLQMAEKNADKTLKEFFSQLGYEVTVKYED